MGRSFPHTQYLIKLMSFSYYYFLNNFYKSMVKLAVASPFVKVKCNFLADSGTQTFSLLLLFSSNEVLQLNLFLKGTLFFGEKGTAFLFGEDGG